MVEIFRSCKFFDAMNAYQEAIRYVKKAQEIRSAKAKKQEGYYKQKK